jgi:uncharacterized GH25 family protein
MQLFPRNCRFVLALVLASTATATAHDLWLVPPGETKPGQPVVGQPVVVRAITGMKFPLGDHPANPAKYARRIVLDPDHNEGTLEPKGADDVAGRLEFVPKKPGIYLVAVQTNPRIIKLDADAFNEYLVSDGLPHIYQLRSKLKILDQPGVERYSKSPKAIVQVGDSPDGDPTKPMGLPLEIVPLQNPLTRRVGDTLRVRVLFQQKPLVDANLGWDAPGAPGEVEFPRGTVRTEAKGEALIPIAQSGPMTIRLTHMTRPMAKDHEWESFWTTLTWIVPQNASK